MITKTQLFENTLLSMNQQNISYHHSLLTHYDQINLLQSCLSQKIISRLRYGSGILVLECGELDGKSKGEISIVCECDWKFQEGFEVTCSSRNETSDIMHFLNQQNQHTINVIDVQEKTGELYLQIGSFCFSTLSTYDNVIGREIWRNRDHLGDFKSYISHTTNGCQFIQLVDKKNQTINSSDF